MKKIKEKIKRIPYRISSKEGRKQLLNLCIFYLKGYVYSLRERKGNGGYQTIAHITYYISGNAGDTVLSKCVRRSFNYFIGVKKWKLISVSEPVTDEIMDKINSCDKLIIGGGGLFLPDTNENEISGWQWAISSSNLEKIQVPICVFSVGYNYFPGQIPSELFVHSVIHLIQKSSFFGLRNRGSVRIIKSLIPEQYHDKILYQPCTTTLIRKLFSESLPEKKVTKCIAVNVAFDREEMRYGMNKEHILSQIAQSIQILQHKGYKLYYICHCTDDKKFLPYLDQLKIEYKYIDFSLQYPKKIIQFYNNMDLVIGMRGHAQMIPFGLNCEIITLGSHDKMRWFLEDIDALDWYVDLTHDTDRICEKIIQIFEEIHEKENLYTRQRLINSQEKLWEITQNNMKKIKNLS